MSNTAENKLEAKLIDAMGQINVGSKWVHYKNPDHQYQVVAIGLNEENQEPCIVYVAQYGKQLVWIRDFDNFTQEVELEGKKVPRFQKV